MVQETTSTTGTGSTIVLTGATPGYVPFSRLFASGDTFFKIENPDGTWAVYEGIWDSATNTLSRADGFISAFDTGITDLDIADGAIISLVHSAELSKQLIHVINQILDFGLIYITQNISGAGNTLANSLSLRWGFTTGSTPASVNIFDASLGICSAQYGRLIAYQSGGTAGTVGDAAVWEISSITMLRGGSIRGPFTINRIFADSAADSWTVSYTDNLFGRQMTVTGETDKDIIWLAQVAAPGIIS